MWDADGTGTYLARHRLCSNSMEMLNHAPTLHRETSANNNNAHYHHDEQEFIDVRHMQHHRDTEVHHHQNDGTTTTFVLPADRKNAFNANITGIIRPLQWLGLYWSCEIPLYNGMCTDEHMPETSATTHQQHMTIHHQTISSGSGRDRFRRESSGPRSEARNSSEQRSCSSCVCEYGLRLLTIGYITMNAYIFYLILQVCHNLRLMYSMLATHTMSALLISLKPLANFCTLSSFLWLNGEHKRLLTKLSQVDHDFAVLFQRRPPWRFYTRCMKLAVTLTALGFFLLRLFELVVTASEAWPNMTRDGFVPWLLHLTSPLTAPLFILWQLVPLYYFAMLMAGVANWFLFVKEKIETDSRLDECNSDFYYAHFRRLTDVTSCINDVMGPFLLCSMTTSIFVLCLTIYFVTNADEILPAFVFEIADIGKLVLRIAFIAWGALQVIVAIIYVLTVSVAGFRVNERARRIMSAVLKAPIWDRNCQLNVTRFAARFQAQQYEWGISIWRTLPVERHLLFTIFGLISTYAVLLLKLQKDHVPAMIGGGSAPEPTPKSLNLTNTFENATMAELLF